MLSPLKLLDIMANDAEAIAKSWAKDVVKNTKTPFYHYINADYLIPQAADFYRKLSSVYTLKDPYPVIQEYMSKFAEKRFKEGVPLHETLYAINLMRRHIWLYAEFQAIFTTNIEQHQAVESQTRTILIFDFIAYTVAEKYISLMEEASRKK